jgi:anti-sigma-K factor RskA
MRAMAREGSRNGCLARAAGQRATRRAAARTKRDMRILLAVMVWITGCAHDVHVSYPAAPDEPTGSIVLLLSQPASDVNVAVNGVLVVEDAHTGRIVINNAPGGTVDLVMTANGSDKAMRVWVGTDRATTIPLGVPDGSTGFLKSLFGTLVTIIAYSLLH